MQQLQQLQFLTPPKFILMKKLLLIPMFIFILVFLPGKSFSQTHFFDSIEFGVGTCYSMINFPNFYGYLQSKSADFPTTNYSNIMLSGRYGRTEISAGINSTGLMTNSTASLKLIPGSGAMSFNFHSDLLHDWNYYLNEQGFSPGNISTGSNGIYRACLGSNLHPWIGLYVNDSVFFKNLPGVTSTSYLLSLNGTRVNKIPSSTYALAGTTMTYPSSGISISTGTAWGTSITDNSANWNNALQGDYLSDPYPAQVLTNSTDNIVSQLVPTGPNQILVSNDYTGVFIPEWDEFPQPDWNQSMSTEMDYIRNKPSLSAMASGAYPLAGIPISTGTGGPWGTSITDNSAHWNSAYGWGNHAAAGYLTSQTSHADVLQDGDFTSEGLMKRISAGTYAIVEDNSEDWNTAVTWGDHSQFGYLSNPMTTVGDMVFMKARQQPATPIPDRLPIGTNGQYLKATTSGSNVIPVWTAFPTIPAAQIQSDWTQASTGSLDYIKNKPTLGALAAAAFPASGIPLSTGSAWGSSITNSSGNWNTAYGWGNHAIAGYLHSPMTTWGDMIYQGGDPMEPIPTRVAIGTNGQVLTSKLVSGNVIPYWWTPTYEQAITASTTNKWWRGDKTWQKITLGNLRADSATYKSDYFIADTNSIAWIRNKPTFTVGSPANGLSVGYWFGMGSGICENRFQMALANATTTGALSSADWNTFNNKVNSQWTNNGTSIFYNIGNIGIGTSAPAYNLNIENVTAPAMIVAQSSVASGDADRAIGVMRIVNTGITPNDNYNISYRKTGGIYNCLQSAQIAGSTVNIFQVDYSTKSLKIGGNGVPGVNGLGDILFMAGKVGIGTTAPDSSVQVTGSSHFTGNMRLDGHLGIGTTTPSGMNMLIDAYGVVGTTGGSVIGITNNGGGGASFQMNDVSYSSKFNFKAFSGGFKITDVNNSKNVFTIENNTASNVLYIKAGGNLGIGMTAPTEKIEVLGNIANQKIKLTAEGGYAILFPTSATLAAGDVVWQSLTNGVIKTDYYDQMPLGVCYSASASSYVWVVVSGLATVKSDGSAVIGELALVLTGTGNEGKAQRSGSTTYGTYQNGMVGVWMQTTTGASALCMVRPLPGMYDGATK